MELCLWKQSKLYLAYMMGVVVLERTLRNPQESRLTAAVMSMYYYGVVLHLLGLVRIKGTSRI